LSVGFRAGGEDRESKPQKRGWGKKKRKREKSPKPTKKKTYNWEVGAAKQNQKRPAWVLGGKGGRKVG